ncbi:MAG: Gamma-glutamyltranspeptidase @ Glutathione hydrolase, partial [uncultured Actinomycetospora sp.]
DARRMDSAPGLHHPPGARGHGRDGRVDALGGVRHRGRRPRARRHGVRRRGRRGVRPAGRRAAPQRARRRPRRGVRHRRRPDAARARRPGP